LNRLLNKEIISVRPPSAHVDAKSERLLGSALNLAEIEDRRSVALENVTQSALPVSTFLELDNGVTIWNSAIFSQAFRRAGVGVFQKPMALVVHVLLISGYPEVGVDCHFPE
jgi:hypothetical protein